ncbi:hypothetical protein SLA2020_209550 [Shorea laevis]
MAAELVNSATSEKLAEVDWTKNIEICELVAQDQRQAKDVIKAIKKRLGSKNSNTQLYAVMLLEMLMNNIGEAIHKQVIDAGILPILVKIVKKKSDLPVRERIFLLLDATQTSLGGASGNFPQYYNAYFDLVNAGVQFPQRPQSTPSNHPTSQENKKNTLNGELAASRHEGLAQKPDPQTVPESSVIIQKAGNALEVLKEVLDTVDPHNPEGARDEFTLDLVEQCSFQKQRIMQVAMTSRDEKVVSRAIELNEQLQKALDRHDALLSGRATVSSRPTSTANHIAHEDMEEEEEPEQLFRRIRKGKACARPEDEEYMYPSERPHLGMFGSSIPDERERLNRPLIRSLSSETSHETNGHPSPTAIPPPPAKHMEREKYFQEKKVDGSTLTGHVRGLSLHSRNASSSRSGSIDFSD